MDFYYIILIFLVSYSPEADNGVSKKSNIYYLYVFLSFIWWNYLLCLNGDKHDVAYYHINPLV